MSWSLLIVAGVVLGVGTLIVTGARCLAAGAANLGSACPASVVEMGMYGTALLAVVAGAVGLVREMSAFSREGYAQPPRKP